MNEISKISVSEQTKFWLSEIVGIENYFHLEINQRKWYSKKLNKYVTAFDSIDKGLIVLSATSGGVSIISFTSIIGAPVGIASATHEEFITVLNEKDKYEKIKNNLINKNEKSYKIMRLSGLKSKT